MNNVIVKLNTPINMCRGDTTIIPIMMNKGTLLNEKGIRLLDNTFLYFGVMEPHSKFENAIIRKKYTKNDVYYEVCDNKYKLSGIPLYNAELTYNEDYVCKDENGNVYYSRINDNKGIPLTNERCWKEVEPKIYVELQPEDTENLCAGKYYIEAKLQSIKVDTGTVVAGQNNASNDPTVITVLPKKILYIVD